MTYFRLRKVRINSQGYDSSGRYLGVGSPLYHYEADYPCSYSHVLNYDAGQCEHDAWPHPGTMKCEWCGRYLRREDNSVSDHIRAVDRQHAMALIRAKYPDATFTAPRRTQQ